MRRRREHARFPVAFLHRNLNRSRRLYRFEGVALLTVELCGALVAERPHVHREGDGDTDGHVGEEDPIGVCAVQRLADRGPCRRRWRGRPDRHRASTRGCPALGQHPALTTAAHSVRAARTPAAVPLGQRHPAQGGTRGDDEIAELGRGRAGRGRHHARRQRRPVLEARTPLDLEADLGLNVLICGAGARRRGGVSGIPGHNAAQRVLEL